MIRRGSILLATMLLAITFLYDSTGARERSEEDWIGKLKESQRLWANEGSGIHNVGNLQLYVTNWGCFGSYPGSVNSLTGGDFPSAQWPANSGVEYLYIAGLWVGAKKSGIAAVSTGAYDIEFQPKGRSDPEGDICIVYEANSNSVGGSRVPRPADDDKDGLEDEDPLDGKDNDGDGSIDEDFAGISSQMFSAWYTDDEESATNYYPDHAPLGLYVHQESYQWEDKEYYNFVGVDFKIIHYSGVSSLDNVYVGFFADGDAGHLEEDKYWMDDCTGYYEGIQCSKKGDVPWPVWLSTAYFFDKDGDVQKENPAPGWLGIVFLGHKTDPLGIVAPSSVGLTSYQAFSGDQPFEDGGDPTNDSERYELMSADQRDRNQDIARDYRMLMATGPFEELMPVDTLSLQVAFAIGEGKTRMLETAAKAAITFEGNWFDVDGNPETGVDGRETPIPGPVSMDPNECNDIFETETAMRGEYLWVNLDCDMEIRRWESSCPKGNAKKEDYMTGVDGKETQVFWLVGTAPPPPNMRIVSGDKTITLFWDNFSEEAPDVSTLKKDFEGFRVWRADYWDRPIGTTEASGPSKELWKLISERDYANGLGNDREFRMPYAQGGLEYEPLQGLRDSGEFDELIDMFEENLYYFPMDTVPCPPGLTDRECDTLEAIARLNLDFAGGKKYYKYVDREVLNGQYYFYSITAFDSTGKYGEPSSNFSLTTPLSDTGNPGEEEGVYVVPNPVTKESLAPWTLGKNMDDPTGTKVEFRKLPACRSTIRIYTLAGDMVEEIQHDGSSGTASWDLVSRNGQEVTSGIYLFSVEPDCSEYEREIGKFVVIK